jgi:hypothetical protein
MVVSYDDHCFILSNNVEVSEPSVASAQWHMSIGSENSGTTVVSHPMTYILSYGGEL